MKLVGRKIGHAIRIMGTGKVHLLASKLSKVMEETVWYDNRCISLKPEGPQRGNVLLSYINDPFYLKPGEALPNSHTHYWESLQIAKAFLDLGYGVDIIRYSNHSFVPAKDYSFIIDARTNLERLSPLLNKDCVKIMHLDTAHWLFHSTAQHRRLWELQQRRGITLHPWKTVTPNWGIEHADCATILGNDFTINTYQYAKKPIYRLRITTPVLYPWSEKDFDACRKRFLWFGSAGLVHKGLDLVLEAFAEMPEYHLTVCGPIDGEKAFQEAYHRELYQSPNIETVGWVDISSPKFRKIVNSCLALIYPSCSEGQSGAVVTCMHAGLIPLISFQSGVDVHEFGVLLKDCSINEIKDSIRSLADLSVHELKSMARRTWEYARTNHTREKFAEDFRKIIDLITNRLCSNDATACWNEKDLTLKQQRC